MQLSLTINNESKTRDISPNETLLHALRANGYFGVKHGCDNGECGACAVLVDGVPMNSCVMLAAPTMIALSAKSSPYYILVLFPSQK